jgi:hypothetical protein
MRPIPLGALVAALLFLVPSSGAARRPVCPDGRFVQATPIVPGSPGGAFDAVVIADGQISIESGCEPTRARLRGLRTGDTRVRARWRESGTLRKVRLNGTIIADGEPCGLLQGALRARRTQGIPIAAPRSRCGDGIVDPGAGETCEPPAAGCGPQCTMSGAIVAPARTWTWVPFADAYCANGTTTGIGINPGDAGGRLLVFLAGGGACWDEATCYQLGTAANIESGYGAAAFAADAGGFLSGSLFNRNDPANPFRDDSFVYVPYCTGDVHAGNKPDASYGGRSTRHVGFQNMAAFLARLVPTFSGASRVILSGSSAGGYGALANWWQTQQAFGSVRVDLIDDSGPPLPAPYLTEGLEQTWREAWNLAAATPPGCAGCATDIDAIFGFYGTAFAGQRGALLSYTQDSVIAFFFQLPGAQMEAGLQALVAEMAPYDVWRHFLVAGSAHTLLGTPDVSQNGVTLRTFLARMVTDDPAWASVAP